MKRYYFVSALIILILILDQALKIWIKTNFEYGEEIHLLGLDWARLHFVENEGMAFGLTIGGSNGKLFLSLFRIIVVIFLGYYLVQLIRAKMPFSFLASMSLILAGALGNIIDSMFYGIIFSDSPYHGGLAELFPAGGGYATFLHGKVVDMFYFPMFSGVFPEWVPFWGGESFIFFRPVFNIADAAITVGVLSIILFQRQFFKDELKKETEDASAGAATSEKKDIASEEISGTTPARDVSNNVRKETEE